MHCCFSVCLSWAGDKSKNEVVWFIFPVKLHNFKDSIEISVQNLKISITPTFENCKIFRLIRSLWYIYKLSCCVWLFCSSYECSGITGQGQDWFQWSLRHGPGGKDQTEDQDHLWKPQPGVGWEVLLVSTFYSFCFCLLIIILSENVHGVFYQ